MARAAPEFFPSGGEIGHFDAIRMAKTALTLY
jgi:hypothetical protein